MTAQQLYDYTYKYKYINIICELQRKKKTEKRE